MIVVRNAICRHTAVVVCLGINHFAILPNGSVTEVYNSFAGVTGAIAKTKQTGTGSGVNFSRTGNAVMADNINSKVSKSVINIDYSVFLFLEITVLSLKVRLMLVPPLSL